MTLFERIHEVIKKRLAHHADAVTPIDTEALTKEVIDEHQTPPPVDEVPQVPASGKLCSSEREAFPDGVPDPISPKPEQPAKTDEVAK